MPKKCFTVGEANEMLPLIERTLGRVFQMRQQLEQIDRELKMADAAPEDRENFEVIIENASMGVTNRRAAIKALQSAIEDELVQLELRGAIVRDVEAGRIDWHYCDGERDIHLCWKLGEPEVTHWHDAQDGCTARRSLDDLRAASGEDTD